MRELQLNLPEGGQPLYLRLAGALRRAVEDGQVKPGELLPSTRRLAEVAGAHRHTVMSALGELVAEGWVEAEAGRGYRVVTTLPDQFLKATPKGPTAGRPGGLRPVWDGPINGWTQPDQNCPYAFPSGQPDLRHFPIQEYSAAVRQTLRKLDRTALLGYGDPAGSPRLRQELWTYLRRMRGITQGRLVVTNGSQEAIFLLGRLLLESGDAVAVEELGYPPAWEALRLAGGRLVGLAVDEDGVIPEALDRLAQETRIGLVYLTPLHQYPTTVTAPAERRLALYEVARRHAIPILEDDYDHEFHYRCQPVAPLKSRDPCGLVLYVSTFSKVFHPAARLGFAVVPEGLGEPLASLKRMTSRQNPGLVQEAVATWMAQGGFERHLRKMRRLYQARLQVMADCLESAAGFRFSRPQGGMSLWVDVGADSEAVARESRRRGLAVRPGADYRLDPGPSQCLRLGFASSTEQEIRQGVKRLEEAVAAVRPA